MRTVIPVMLVSLVCGCAFETPEQGDQERLGVVQSATTEENSLEPNGLNPNGIRSNGIRSNGLTSVALSTSTIGATELAALQDPTDAGDLSRKFLKYAVGCAFNPDQSITINWLDSLSAPQTATYSGSLGLAPGWATQPLSLTEQQWVSACMAARTNYFGVTVMISLRAGVNAALGADTTERAAYAYQEGAFWGNLFDSPPVLHSCYVGANIGHSRSKQRACASGYYDGSSTTSCGIINIEGDCSSVCNTAADPGLGFSSCQGATQIISTFLN